MTEDINDLFKQLNGLKETIEKIEQKNAAKKQSSRCGQDKKLYTGKSGFYFELTPDLDQELYMQIKNQIDTRLQDPIYFNLINKIDLGRVILDYYYNTHNMIFWVANQNTLLFGPARRGIKEAQSGDIFKIPLDKLKTISTSDDKHENLIALKTTIKFNEFIQQEKKKMALNRLRKQLNVETPKKKQAS